MNWLKRIFTKASQAAISLVPQWLANVRWLLDSRFQTLAKEGHNQSSVVYACVRLLSQSVPEAPMKIYKLGKQGDEEIADHEARALIKKPNPLQTEFEFWELTIIYLSITGRACWWKERGRGGRPIALWPLRPDRIQPIYGKPPSSPYRYDRSDDREQSILKGWLYDLEGRWYELPVEDVLAFNYPNPAGESGGIVEGLGPLQALAREVDADNQATRLVYALTSNYAVPGILIKLQQTLKSEEEAKLYKEKWKATYGNNNAGDVAILDGGGAIERLSFNLTELEFPQLRAIAESRIAAGFGVPSILVGLKAGLDRATYSNMEQARQYFAETTLSTLWRRLSDQITCDLLPEFDRSGEEFARFDTAKVRALAGQQAKEAERYEKAFERGAVTLNEYRTKALGLEPLPDGDARLIPNNVQEVGAMNELNRPVHSDAAKSKVIDFSRDYSAERVGRIKALANA